jgi:hypothetical protein
VAAKPSVRLASKASFVQACAWNTPLIEYRRRRTEENPFDHLRPPEPSSHDADAINPTLQQGPLEAASDEGNPVGEEMETVPNLESRRHSLGETGADSTMGIVHKVIFAPHRFTTCFNIWIRFTNLVITLSSEEQPPPYLEAT